MKLIELKVKLIKKENKIEYLKVKFVFIFLFHSRVPILTNNGNNKYILHLENILFYLHILFIHLLKLNNKAISKFLFRTSFFASYRK